MLTKVLWYHLNFYIPVSPTARFSPVTQDRHQQRWFALPLTATSQIAKHNIRSCQYWNKTHHHVLRQEIMINILPSNQPSNKKFWQGLPATCKSIRCLLSDDGCGWSSLVDNQLSMARNVISPCVWFKHPIYYTEKICKHSFWEVYICT